MENDIYSNLQTPEVEVRYKDKLKASERFKLSTSSDTFQCFKKIFDSDTFQWKEEFLMIMLNRVNRVLGFYKVSHGGMAGTVVDPKIVFVIALKAGAHSIIIAHNHPSGEVTPSPADTTLTKRLVECGKMLELPVLDHMIMGDDKYYSFADEGLL